MKRFAAPLVFGFALACGGSPAQSAEPFMDIGACRAKNGSPALFSRDIKKAFCIIEDARKPKDARCLQRHGPLEYIFEDDERDRSAWYFCALAEMNADDVYEYVRARQRRKAGSPLTQDQPKAASPAPVTGQAQSSNQPRTARTEGDAPSASQTRQEAEANAQRQARAQDFAQRASDPMRYLKMPSVHDDLPRQKPAAVCASVAGSSKISNMCDFNSNVPMFANFVVIPAQHAQQCPPSIEVAYTDPTSGKELTSYITAKRSVIYTCGAPLTRLTIR